MKSYFRPEIDRLSGYVPGEQPKMLNLVKLNTNENPYPPSPAVDAVLRNFDTDALRRYSDPHADALRDAIAARHGVSRDMVIAGNGSDDILTMIFRAFTDHELGLACPEPTYSLYSVLAAMQGATVKKIALCGDDFHLPEDFLQQAAGMNLLAMARPNAPSGNTFPLAAMEKICAGFDGIVLIDEAYADFADDSCMDFVGKYDNVIVSRTFSKSYSLAGMRLGYAVGDSALIGGLFKLKDSYNLDAVTQAVGLAAFNDTAYLHAGVAKVKSTRARLNEALRQMNFTTVPSSTNFIFAMPPDGDGERYFRYLREQAVIVRYFKGAVTGKYVRITVGTGEQTDRLLAVTADYLKG